jgi:NAD(P)-dependent dehydrogenase (short-subunit alcohol dehydrogenase family)
VRLSGPPHRDLGRFQTVDDTAKLVAFLVSDEAKDINGENILLNGGQVMN